MVSGPEINKTFRAVIVAYRFDLRWQYMAITERLSVEEEAIKSLCRRVKKRCDDAEQRSNANRLDVLLSYVANKPDRGRPRRAEPGSTLALIVRRGVKE